MEVSVRERLLRPIEALFKKSMLFVFCFTLITSFYKIYTSHHKTQSFLAKFVDSISHSADVDGNLIYLQKEIDQLMSSIQTAGLSSGHIIVDINGRNAAEAGRKTIGLFALSLKTRSILPSGNTIGVQVDVDTLQILLRELLRGLGFLIFLIFLLSIIKSKIEKSLAVITNPLEELASILSNADIIQNTTDFNSVKRFEILEINSLSDSIQTYIKTIKNNEEKIAQLEKDEIFSKISRQVAHDIRSPLSALNIVMQSLSEIPEDRRLLIRNATQRINDIANDLLAKGKVLSENRILARGADNPKNLPAPTTSIILLPVLVDFLVSEKRIQYRNHISIRIESDLQDSFGAFVLADSKELMRLLSNLINNSIEAFSNETGEVTVAVRAYRDIVVLRVCDNGMGIPPNILEKLGATPLSYGKEGAISGSGLGVSHAISTIESIGGSLQISSKVGVGTSIDIKIPRCATPSWFPTEIFLNSNSHVLVLDDDLTIHQIWKGRLEEGSSPSHTISIANFTAAHEFRKYFTLNIQGKDLSNYLFLIDYELLGQSVTGLEIIEVLGLSTNVILVTSRYEDPFIIEKCAQLKIKLLPKALAGSIPIKIEKPKTINCDWILIEDEDLVNRAIETNSTPKKIFEEKKRYDLCLIDDDQELVGAVWAAVAKEKGLKIKLFATSQDFLAEADKIEWQTPIYVDVSLGNGVSGIDVTHDIHKMGFTEINLATGYQADSMVVPHFICRVVGKDFPNLG